MHLAQICWCIYHHFFLPKILPNRNLGGGRLKLGLYYFFIIVIFFFLLFLRKLQAQFNAIIFQASYWHYPKHTAFPLKYRSLLTDHWFSNFILKDVPCLHIFPHLCIWDECYASSLHRPHLFFQKRYSGFQRKSVFTQIDHFSHAPQPETHTTT